MDKQNTTCIQTVTLTFNLYPKTGKYSNGLVLTGLGKELNLPEDIKGLKDYLSNRLERISGMVQLLLNVDSGWKSITKKDKVILQISSLDFNEIQNFLNANGFATKEYSLTVDYSRKWGVL
jgi:hypothetical protein